MLTKQLPTIKWVNFYLTSYNFFTPFIFLYCERIFARFDAECFFSCHAFGQMKIYDFSTNSAFIANIFIVNQLNVWNVTKLVFFRLRKLCAMNIQFLFGLNVCVCEVFSSHRGICMSHASKLIVERFHSKFKKCVCDAKKNAKWYMVGLWLWNNKTRWHSFSHEPTAVADMVRILELL